MKNSNLRINLVKKKDLEALNIHLMIRRKKKGKTAYTRTLDSLEKRREVYVGWD
jgi:hypothetical protein